jgi:hypothetical protein
MSSSSDEVVAVLNDGPESYHVLKVKAAEAWKIFALAKWKTVASNWSSEVDLVARPLYVRHASDLSDILEWDYGHQLLPCNAEGPPDDWFWRPDLMEHRGFVKWEDFDIQLSHWDYKNEVNFDVHINLTASGRAKALEYARGLIEDECRKKGKPVPWETTP